MRYDVNILLVYNYYFKLTFIYYSGSIIMNAIKKIQIILLDYMDLLKIYIL